MSFFPQNRKAKMLQVLYLALCVTVTVAIIDEDRRRTNKN